MASAAELRLPTTGEVMNIRSDLLKVYGDPAVYTEGLVLVDQEGGLAAGIGVMSVTPEVWTIDTTPIEIEIIDGTTALGRHVVERSEVTGHFREEVGVSVLPGYRQFDHGVTTTAGLWQATTGENVALYPASYRSVTFLEPVRPEQELVFHVQGDPDESGITANVTGMVDDQDVVSIKGLRLERLPDESQSPAITVGQLLEFGAQTFILLAAGNRSLDTLRPAFRGTRGGGSMLPVQSGDQVYASATIGNKRNLPGGGELLTGAMALYRSHPESGEIQVVSRIDNISGIIYPR